MGKTATAPNYAGAAQQQSDASHVGSQGPFGSTGWTKGPDGQWTQSQQFNGPLAGAAQGYEQQLAGQGALDLSGLPQVNYGQQAGQQAYDAAYGQATSRLDPQFAQQHEALQSQLASQGLDPTSEAAQTAEGNFGRNQNDAYSSARNAAFGQGQQAQQQSYQQSMGARQQALTELLKQRGMPMEQLQALQGLLGPMQATGAAMGPNYLGAAQMQGDFDLGNAQSQNQLYGSLFSAAGSAGAAAMGAPPKR